MEKTEKIENKMQEKKINKMVPIICLLFAVIAVVIGIFLYANMPSAKVRKQLDLGNKYLSELDYEQAVVAFSKVMDIEPDNVDARLGLADAYIGLGQTDKAIDVLQTGYDLTQDSRLLDKLNSIKESIIEEPQPVEENTDDTEDWQSQFEETREMLNAFRGNFSAATNSRGNGDWEEIFVTTDELVKIYDPLITKLEEYVEYRNNHDIQISDEVAFFGSAIDYQLRDFYIVTHQFDKSAKLDIYSGESMDGYGSEHDEYNRLIYQEQANGDNTTFTWGEDGNVQSYVSVYESGEAYDVGTVEECSFEYDNGRIVAEHVKQTFPPGSVRATPGTYYSDMTYTYDGDTVTMTCSSNGHKGSVYTYKINEYGRGKLISEEH